jgi:hypothetical protein
MLRERRRSEREIAEKNSRPADGSRHARPLAALQLQEPQDALAVAFAGVKVAVMATRIMGQSL